MGYDGFDAVIFDLDGVIIDSERLSFDAWATAAELAALAFDSNLAYRMIGKSQLTCVSILEEYFACAEKTKRLIETRDRVLTDQIAKRAIPYKPGFDDLLRSLESREMRFGLASSSDRAWILGGLGEHASRFSSIMGFEDVTATKPNPEIYLKSLERLNCPADRCVVIEDSPTGLRAAAAAGIRTILIPDLLEPGPEEHQLAWRVARSLMDVPDILERA